MKAARGRGSPQALGELRRVIDGRRQPRWRCFIDASQDGRRLRLIVQLDRKIGSHDRARVNGARAMRARLFPMIRTRLRRLRTAMAAS